MFRAHGKYVNQPHISKVNTKDRKLQLLGLENVGLLLTKLLEQNHWLLIVINVILIRDYLGHILILETIPREKSGVHLFDM